MIHVYDCADLPLKPATELASVESKSIEPVARYDTKGSRLVCVAFADGEVPASAVHLGTDGGAGAKRKRAEANGKVSEPGREERGSAKEDSSDGDDEMENEGEEDNWGGVE